jgi:prephenate dehydrogenase
MKVTIIGLGLTGNSIGMALRRAASTQKAQKPPLTVRGFDPDRAREQAALHRYGSVDEIAPDLEQAVRGAQIVVLSTPASALREVLAALNPLLDEGTTVTDTLAFKEQVMAWAGELLGPHVSFVGGRPFSRSADLDAVEDSGVPTPDLFAGALYAIMPLPGARNEALSHVIWLAETIGARPLFIDPREHDSYLAAVGQLPLLAGAGLWSVAAASPAWADMKGVVQPQFKRIMEVLQANPATLRDSLMGNRQALLRWLDQYMLALHQLRDLLANDDAQGLLAALTQAHDSHAEWVSHADEGSEFDRQLRAELRQAAEGARPTRALLGGYLTDRIFGKKDRHRDGKDHT